MRWMKINNNNMKNKNDAKKLIIQVRESESGVITLDDDRMWMRCPVAVHIYIQYVDVERMNQVVAVRCIVIREEAKEWKNNNIRTKDLPHTHTHTLNHIPYIIPDRLASIIFFFIVHFSIGTTLEENRYSHYVCLYLFSQLLFQN